MSNTKQTNTPKPGQQQQDQGKGGKQQGGSKDQGQQRR